MSLDVVLTILNEMSHLFEFAKSGIEERAFNTKKRADDGSKFSFDFPIFIYINFTKITVHRGY